jgi:hypothetical protein
MGVRTVLPPGNAKLRAALFGKDLVVLTHCSVRGGSFLRGA